VGGAGRQHVYKGSKTWGTGSKQTRSEVAFVFGKRIWERRNIEKKAGRRLLRCCLVLTGWREVVSKVNNVQDFPDRSYIPEVKVPQASKSRKSSQVDTFRGLLWKLLRTYHPAVEPQATDGMEHSAPRFASCASPGWLLYAANTIEVLLYVPTISIVE